MVPWKPAATLDLTGVPGSFTAGWFNPRTGKPAGDFLVAGEA
jgi:hypothetical protein